MEIEAKYTVPDEATFTRLAEATALGPCELETGVGVEVRDTYVDSAGRDLLAAGWFCRKRRRAGRLAITCKGLGGVDVATGVHQREELEVTLRRDSAPSEWPDGPVRDLVLGLVGEAALTPLVEIRQTRLVRRALKGAAQIAEVSIDRVVVVDGAGHPLPPFFEIEAELTGDAYDDLAAIAAALRDEWGLQPQPHSKFERALEVAGIATGPGTAETEAPPVTLPPLPIAEPASARAPRAAGARRTRPKAAVARREALSRRRAARTQPSSDAASAAASEAATATPAAPKQARSAPDAPRPAARRSTRRPGLKADDTMAEAARKTLRFHFERMLTHEDGTRLGEDPEELHVMRVSTRRMRAALRVFGPHLDPVAMAPHLKGLRRTGHALGDVRDLDVFDEKTRQYLATLPEDRHDDLAPLTAAWRRERDAARDRMLAYLDSPAYRRFVTRFGEFLDSPHAGEPAAVLANGECRPQRVGDVLPAILYERAAAVWAYDAPLAEPDPPLTRFHRLRIAGKSLRYTLEFFEEVLGSEAKPLISATKKLQDHLGDLQDAVVASTVLRTVLTWDAWQAPARLPKQAPAIVVAPGVANYLAARQEELHHLVVTFPQVWPQVRGPEFARRLAAVVATLTTAGPAAARSRAAAGRS